MTLKKPPIHPPIEAGESPLFYLKRLALLNHYDSHTWLYKNAEDRVSRNLSQLVDYLTEEDWTKQAEQDEAALRIFQLENFHLVKKARFCPICISEDKIWRATWHLKTSVTCVKHEVNLVDVCTTCCADTDLFKAKLHECVCGAPYGEQSTVRASKNKKEVYVHPDWVRHNTMKEKLSIIPLYPNTRGSRFVLQFKDYEPTFQFYGLPDYIAALEHIAVDYEIGKWNHTKFKNGFQPSAIIEINGDMGEEEAKKLVREAQKKFVGDGNNGKIMFIVKNGDASQANVQIIKDDQEGSWIDLQRITDQNIVTAHRWQPSLSGLVSSGKMNNTGSEIRIAYDLAMTTVIKDTSDLLLNGLRTILFKEMGFLPEELLIHYEPPISFATQIDPKEILTINEQRKMLDEDLPMLEDGNMFIKDREQITVTREDETQITETKE